jgi:hypothetical protein
VQEANAAPSRAHWKVEPASFDENANVALVLVVVEGGPESIVVSGGVVSGGPEPTVHVQTAGVGSVLAGFAASVARTRKLCSPNASPE